MPVRQRRELPRQFFPCRNERPIEWRDCFSSLRSDPDASRRAGGRRVGREFIGVPVEFG
jgi:hypothetical protein